MNTKRKLLYVIIVALAVVAIILASLYRNKHEVVSDGTQGEIETSRNNEEDTLLFLKKYRDYTISVIENLYTEYRYDYYCRDAALMVNNKKGITCFERTEDFYPHWDDGVFETGLPDYFYMEEYNTGNCAICGAWFLLKITADTAFVVGMVNGYDDIDSNGIREFYYNEAYWMPWQSHAEMEIERIEIKLINDSLIFPGDNVFK
jgi:hypothetical protein